MLRRLLDSPYTYFVAAALLVLGWFASRFELRGPPRPTAPIDAVRELPQRDDLNVVFILIDTLRADHLGSYGYERDTTPTLDLLAEHGVRFANHMAQSSWTKTSMASLWTAQYPARNGVLRYPHGIPQSVVTPVEIMKDAGYYAAGIYRNGWIEPNFGFGQGFDKYFQPKTAVNAVEVRRHQLSHRLAGTDHDLMEAAGEFLRNYKHERFLLYLHLMDLHQYTFGHNFARYGTRYVDYYDNALAWTDALISNLVKQLIDMDLMDRTILVVASDHGEEFREHYGEGHAKTLYREVIQVPLIIALPFNIEGGGVVVEQVTANVDVWPTLLDLLGLPPMPEAQGRSLVPAILGEDLPERPVFSQIDGRWGRVDAEPYPMVAVTTEEWRQIRYLEESERDELFDYTADQTEQHNVIAEKPEVRSRLEEIVERHLADKDGAEPTHHEIDELRLNQLRALGYAIQ